MIQQNVNPSLATRYTYVHMNVLFLLPVHAGTVRCPFVVRWASDISTHVVIICFAVYRYARITPNTIPPLISL